MPEAKPLAVDLSRESSTLEILASPPLLSSYKFGWDNIQVQYYQQPAWETQEHCHTQHEITISNSEQTIPSKWVLDGRRQSTPLGNQDIVVIPSQAPHKASWAGEGKFIVLLLEPNHIAHVAHESVDSDRVEMVPHFATPDPVIYQIGLLLKAELESTQVGSRLYVEGLTTTLSVHMLRNYCTWQTIREYAGGLPKRKLQQAIEYINEYLDRDISLEAIAQVLGMSQYYFCRLFKQSMGVTPYQYVLQQRVNRAKQLLKQKDVGIADIALACGFANQHHFTKMFKQFVGTTPKVFRENNS